MESVSTMEHDRSVVAITSPEALNRFVRDMLCSHDHLDPAQTPLYRAEVKRRGKLCGLIFHVEGPRLLKTSAIWSADEHRIIFYDSAGAQFTEVKLSDAPTLEAIAA